MSEELKQAAQRAVETLELARNYILRPTVSRPEGIADKCLSARANLHNALTTSQPAQAGEVDERVAFEATAPIPTPAPPFATYDEHGNGCDDEIQDFYYRHCQEVETRAFNRGYDAASLPTQPAAQATPEPTQHDGTRGPFDGAPMNAEKAAYFMRRFKREEKLLGPNEQRAIDYVLSLLEAQQATPEPGLLKTFLAEADRAGEPVGELVAVLPDEVGFHVRWLPHTGPVLKVGDRIFAHPAPGVPEGEPNEMESKWCWWIGDYERFHIADNEPEAHGEAQCRIDDDCDPGQTHQYSVARVQHPLDALGMDWLALHVAESIAENVCCWCDDNTGAEEPSIMLSPDDSKALGLMVATFLRHRVGVDWWTADQKTVTVHTYVSGSNDDPALAAAQAKGADHA